MKLSRFIFQITNIIHKAKQLKADETKQPKTIRYSVFSIVYSLVAIPLSCLIVLLVKSLETGNPVLIIGGVMLGVALGVFGTLIMLFYGILHWILQLYINKKPIGWVAAIIWLLALIACVGVNLYLLNAL